jgi:hypothetical protein
MKSSKTETVKVVVRVRPLNEKEIARGCQSIVEVERQLGQLSINSISTQVPKTFAFDSVYGQDSRQRVIYDETAFPLVESVLEGYNGTIFAYGQTGCGKTFTMTGVPNDEEKRGIIPNSFCHIFSAIEEVGAAKTFLVRCSYIEIYNEELRDLLGIREKKKLELKENKDQGIYIKNLSQHIVKNIGEIDALMTQGSSHRITKETNMNERSSRSHALFVIYIEQSEMSEGRQIIKAGKLNLVDLAGSERQKKTDAVGERLKEAIEINLSLSALGNVISALVDGNVKHVPYRDSKLTRLLQDSLGGNTKTVMIAVTSPADYNYEESLSTLRYASRAKFIQNKPTVNEDPKDALLRSYVEEISRLKRLLEERSSGEPIIIEKIVEKIVERPVDRVVERVVGNDKRRRNKEHRTKGKGSELESIESEDEGAQGTQSRRRELSDSGSSREITASSKQSGEKTGSSKGRTVARRAGKQASAAVYAEETKAVPTKSAKSKPTAQATLLDDSDYEEESPTPQTKKRTQPSKPTAGTDILDDSDYLEEAKSPQPKKKGRAVKQSDEGNYSDDFEGDHKRSSKPGGVSKQRDSGDKADARSPQTKKKGPAVKPSDEGDYSDDFEGDNKRPSKSGGVSKQAAPAQKQLSKNKQSSKRTGDAKETQGRSKPAVSGDRQEDDEYSDYYESESEHAARQRKGPQPVHEDDYSDEFEEEGRAVQPAKQTGNAVSQVTSKPARKSGNRSKPSNTPVQKQAQTPVSSSKIAGGKPDYARQVTQAKGTGGLMAVKSRSGIENESSQDETYSSFEDEDSDAKGNRTKTGKTIKTSTTKADVRGKTSNKRVEQLGFIETEAGIQRRGAPANKRADLSSEGQGSTEFGSSAKTSGNPRSKPTHKPSQAFPDLQDSGSLDAASERARLENFVSDIQNQLISGGKVLDQADKERLLAQRNFQKQLKEQSGREEAMREATRKREEDMLMTEKLYSNQTEEIADQRRVIAKLRMKYRGAMSEIEDLNKEQARQREDIFDSVRSLEHEIDFLRKVLEFVIAPEELQMIKAKSKFKEDDNTWSVAPFVLQQSQTFFPKIPKGQAREMAMNDIKNRQLVFSHRIGLEDAGYNPDFDDKSRSKGSRPDPLQVARSVEPVSLDKPRSSKEGSRQVKTRSKKVILNPIESAPPRRKLQDEGRELKLQAFSGPPMAGSSNPKDTQAFYAPPIQPMSHHALKQRGNTKASDIS